MLNSKLIAKLRNDIDEAQAANDNVEVDPALLSAVLEELQDSQDEVKELERELEKAYLPDDSEDDEFLN